MTQFGRASAELNIEILCADTSQAKGRVERVNRTLQDRLVKALRLAGIDDMAAGNAYLPGFMARFNERFARHPARSDNLHRALNMQPDRLERVFCLRDKRYVGKSLALTYERKRIILEINDLSERLVGRYVDIFAFADGRLEVLADGVSLPFKVYDKDQRVEQAAVTENKRLTDVLAYVKEQQSAQAKAVQVKPSSARNGYKKTGKRSRGRPSFVDQHIADKSKKAARMADPGCDIARSTPTSATLPSQQ